jgi:MoaA/NifB/PqqE/SkfB family radical SAM enzyme
VGEHKKVFPLFQSPLIKKQMTWDRKEFNNFWHEKPEFWDEVYSQIPNITQLYFAGGEPLMIREHHMFLEKIIEMGYASKISLRYNTNGILINEKIISIWTHFKKVKVGVSMDAVGDRLFYIRNPTEFSQVESNLWRLEDTPDNIEFSIACAVQILNIKHIPDFIKWKVSAGFKKLNNEKNIAGYTAGGGLMGVHLLWIPTWLSLRVLPKEDKIEIRKSFMDLKDWLYNNYTQDDEFWKVNPHGWKRWESILDWMDSEDQSYLLPDFREYINTLDKQRNTDFSKTFPELRHLL